MSNVNLIAEARRNAPESVDESLIMRLVIALEARPTILGYVVVGRHGRLMGGGEQYLTRTEAQDVADEWTHDAETNDVDWDYRVAEITEPTT